VNVIKRYIDDPRIRFFQNEKNIGMSENFRISIEERAKGFFFTTVNSDDKLIFKSFISESVKLTQKYNEVVLVKTGCVLRKGNSSKVKSHNNYKEYLSGFDFIKLYNFNEDFGWGGYLIDLNKFKDFNFFSSKVVGLDYFINLNLITKGNLCFLKETCYEFNIHETNESKLCYTKEQIFCIQNELNLFFVRIKNSIEDFENVKFKYEFNYISNILEDNYRNNRKEFYVIYKTILNWNKKAVIKYNFSYKGIINYIFFYFPCFGFFAERLKWNLMKFIKF
jgi:hypothetical protein